MGVRWLDDVAADDLETVGGKAASLGELATADLPVPPGFVVTADTFRRFVEGSGIAEDLYAAVDVDVEDSAALAEAERRAGELITGTPLPEAVVTEIEEAYARLDGGEASVAVRSSATAEDLPEASFAGQQETFLNVAGATDVVDRVKRCWASLFTGRAIYYRRQQGFEDRDVDVAVVVQRMVDAERSGVLFTSHPSTGAPRVVVEAAWGLGEGVVSGSVSPDNYVLDRETGVIEDVTVSDKRTMYVRDPDSGETVERAVPDDRRTERVLSEADLDRLVGLARRVESHYGTPQDVEWAMADGEVYVLQSRPITTIDDAADAADEDELLITGLGASPGTTAGAVRVIRGLDELDKVDEGDVIVAEMTTPDMVPAMKRAAAIVTDEGGLTCHASIVSRELGVPAVVGTGDATRTLDDGRAVTVDGDKGTVRAGAPETSTSGGDDPAASGSSPSGATGSVPETNAGDGTAGGAAAAGPGKPLTATKVFVNVSIPDAAERAAATGADGVGLLRLEHLVLGLGKTPERYVADHGAEAYVDELVRGVRTVADAFYPRPVRVRTLDAPTDEFRQLTGGDDEPEEHNPMLGFRGIRRSLAQPDTFEHELRAFRRLYDMGYDNVEVMVPLVNDAEDVRRAREHLEGAGIDPSKRAWGAMIETPAAALCAAEIAETGIDFASFGTNDLTQYTLAVDRNNERVADRFDELHPAVLRLLRETIAACRERGVDTSICGEAGSRPEMVRELVGAGIGAVSANIDAVAAVQQEVARVEQRLLLEAVRED